MNGTPDFRTLYSKEFLSYVAILGFSFVANFTSIYLDLPRFFIHIEISLLVDIGQMNVDEAKLRPGNLSQFI